MTATRYIERFGVELEGGWDSYPPDRERLRRDSSVECDGETYVGECTSQPFETLDEGLHWVASNYPDHRSYSCGLHVHMSFKPHTKCVAFLADSIDYWTNLKSDLETWGRQKNVKRSDFWSRLRGENSYCEQGTRWDATRVLRGREADRYRAVNWQALNRHGTIEIRVLPMFKSARLAQGAISTVLQSTDNYLTARFRDPNAAGPVVDECSADLTPTDLVLPPFNPFAEEEEGN